MGLLGFCTYVINYCCLSFRLMSSESARYFAINIVAASLVLFSLMTDFNLASALIQTFWILIGVCAIVLRTHRTRRARNAAFRAPVQDPT
ncbi:CBU_0592 family membrane protein [Thalassococcus sp. BH17M4-6]|uniref:CBU_0592 family membrane protein n=1 Tax=Thalassococcus sp. BH17M4-6 TaxID=3413148 RepID=UPI003BF5C38B